MNSPLGSRVLLQSITRLGSPVPTQVTVTGQKFPGRLPGLISPGKLNNNNYGLSPTFYYSSDPLGKLGLYYQDCCRPGICAAPGILEHGSYRAAHRRLCIRRQHRETAATASPGSPFRFSFRNGLYIFSAGAAPGTGVSRSSAVGHVHSHTGRAGFHISRRKTLRCAHTWSDMRRIGGFLPEPLTSPIPFPRPSENRTNLLSRNRPRQRYQSIGR